MKNKNCEVCGRNKEVRNYKGKQLLCGMHREQMRRFGKIRPRTLRSSNIFIDMKTTRERFEEKFGKPGPDGSSIGRGAGCDDCEINQRTRKEHLAFVESEKAIQREEDRAEILRGREKIQNLETFTEEGQFTKDTLLELCDDLLSLLTPNHNG